MVYSVTKYGAVGDGATNDAAAIQSAIDACNAAGGGRVVLEGGHTYYSSSIELKSNVELHLEQGALLKAHSDISTYFNPNGDDASVAAVSGAKAVGKTGLHLYSRQGCRQLLHHGSGRSGRQCLCLYEAGKPLLLQR